MYWPATLPKPGSDVDHARRASRPRPSARRSSGDESGVISAGFITTLLPAASAGRHLPAGEHQREVPRHDLADHADRLAQHVVEKARLDRNDRRPGTCRPCRRSSGSTPRCAARRACGVSRIGWPVSSDSRRASSSAFASIRSASFSRMRPRSAAAMRLQVGKARCAAATARSTSALPAIATSAIIELSCGLSVASVSPARASTNSPSMKSWWRMAWRATRRRRSGSSRCPMSW